MNLYFRLMLILIKQIFSSRITPKDDSVLTFKVLPTDIDVNFHMNNGRYLTVMDLGRIDFMARAGVLTHMIRNRWYPVVGEASLSFKRSLKMFNRYKLITTLKSWDDKWFYLEQTFMKGDNIIASGHIKGQIRGASGCIQPQTVLDSIGYSEQPDHI